MRFVNPQHHGFSRRGVAVFVAAMLLIAGCGSAELERADTGDADAPETTTDETPASAQDLPATDKPDRRPANVDPDSLPRGELIDFGPAPVAPSGPLDDQTQTAVEDLMGALLLPVLQGQLDDRSSEAIEELGASGDPRVAWWLSDLLRISQSDVVRAQLVAAARELLDTDFDLFNPWGEVTNRLMAWDIAAPPDYLMFKRNAYLLVEPRWEDLFADGADIDWRFVSWGGVRLDGRDYDQTDIRCNCIPAADNPTTTDIATGDGWLDDDTIVFGVSINGESRAYPRSIMEVREMVNDTLGDRDFAMPYCTLCGSAQLYFTDEVPDGIERPVLRTSGLLSRSNKVMFDINTYSIFDTFRGQAVSGPLLEAGVSLNQHSVVTTTWGAWKQDHPETTVLAIELANGRPDSDLRNTRDANGPIFPIGDVDPRLPIQEDVLGVFTSDGSPVAFHVSSAVDALERGEYIVVDGIGLELDGGGLRAVDAETRRDLGGHQAFWFAWSQFHPDTVLWPNGVL